MGDGKSQKVDRRRPVQPDQVRRFADPSLRVVINAAVRLPVETVG